MKKRIIAGGILGATVLLGACAVIPRAGPVGNRQVPEPAKAVDVNQYLGLWHEQFRYEASFEKNMDMVTAHYSLNGDGSVKVVNKGRSQSGKWKDATGKAKVVDRSRNAKLKVSFFGPIYGNYWVLDHGEDYDWSIVGEPSGRYLWVLTRDRHPSPDLLAQLEERVKQLGYDWSLVRITKQ
jgi:apolipoprotein D and lipocalin family protein